MNSIFSLGGCGRVIAVDHSSNVTHPFITKGMYRWLRLRQE